MSAIRAGRFFALRDDDNALFTVRAEIITELISERVGPVIFQNFLLELIAFRLIPVISPARRAKPENCYAGADQILTNMHRG